MTICHVPFFVSTLITLVLPVTNYSVAAAATRGPHYIYVPKEPPASVPGEDGDLTVVRQYLYADQGYLWNTTKIPVCWDNPGPTAEDASRRRWVKEAITNSWEANTVLDFVGWGSCTSNEKGIRIAVRNDWPHAIALGSRLAGKPGGVVLNFSDPTWIAPTGQYTEEERIKIVAMHEFGHAIGLAHEQNRSDTPSACTKDPEGSDGTLAIGPWDDQSVMNYCNNTWRGGLKLSTSDIRGVNILYGQTAYISGGSGWGSSAGVTSIAFGDIDGDGRDEVGVTRAHSGNARYWIYDDAVAGSRLLLSGGQRWGSSRHAEAIAFGNVDDDPQDEVVIARDGGDGWRLAVYDYGNGSLHVRGQLGSDWGDSYGVRDVALGDVDGDGRDEITFVRTHGSNPRVYIVDDAVHKFSVLYRKKPHPGEPTKVAVGDVDGDGRDEVVVAISRARKTSKVWVIDKGWTGFKISKELGGDWEGARQATDVACGDVDKDGRDEVVIGRSAGGGARYFVLDDATTGYAVLFAGGNDWGNGTGATEVAVGDVDGDGIDEIGIGRFVDEGNTFDSIADVLLPYYMESRTRGPVRLWILDDKKADFQTLVGRGGGWGRSRHVSALAFGDFDGDGDQDYAIGRNQGGNMRFAVIESKWN